MVQEDGQCPDVRLNADCPQGHKRRAAAYRIIKNGQGQVRSLMLPWL